MSCDNCEAFYIRIGSPDNLTDAIRFAEEKVKSGALISIGFGSCGDPFDELSRTELWNDIVNNYFKCSFCGQLFSLHAETYRGGGGALEAVDKVNGELYTSRIY